MAKRWNERSRKALTDLGTGGGDVEGGRGVAVKSFSCPVQFIVFCFYGRHVSLITSFFIQEYEWLTADKREIWKNGLGKMHNYIFQFRPAN